MEARPLMQDFGRLLDWLRENGRGLDRPARYLLQADLSDLWSYVLANPHKVEAVPKGWPE